MRILLRKCTSLLMAGVLGVASLSFVPAVMAESYYDYETEKPTGGEMLADAFMVRPFMLVGTVLTSATFLVTLPLSALGGNVGDAANTLVAEPFKYTFVRPLGDM